MLTPEVPNENNRKEVSFTRFLKDGNQYIPIGDTRDVLPSGFYTPVWDTYNNKIYFTKKEIIMPKLYVLPNDIQTSIIDDVKKFWNNEERYKKFGSVYKRNILLYSLPGNGKTSLINIICNKLIDEYNGVIICIDSPRDLIAYKMCMERFRAIEPTRRVITIIEDFEHLAKDDDSSALLLQTLDGNAQYDNIVTIATTNYPQLLEKRFTCRPSRFNLVIEYKKPTAEIREAYMINKLSDGGIDVNDEKVKEDIKRYVKKTEGYTFDFVKEVIQGIYIDDISEDEVFKRLDDIIKKDGKVKVTEESLKKVGFATETGLDEEDEMPADVITKITKQKRGGFLSGY
jgi:hypothetical protein